MAREITDISDIGTGDMISKGMQTFEVVDVQPEPEGFGPPFKATVEAQKDLGDFGTAGEQRKMGKGDLLSGFEFVD